MSNTGESQDIDHATSAISPPDNKTRRYDRQLRLWAASGQSALESARILVLSASATSTAVLKNLVLPGIGSFTLLDPADATSADAGNNFFLNGQASVGRPRAVEAVPLLRELNDSVGGEAVVRNVEDVLSEEEGREWVRGFSLVVAHNLRKDTLERLAKMLWEDVSAPPLIVVRSAGFLAEFFIQFHEQCVSEPHTDETPPSLRITRPFPALREWAVGVDYDALDPTDHGHVPFAVILVRAVEDWKAEHGALPSTYAEKQAFKAVLRALKKKPDEENFDEAEAQAWRVWAGDAAPADVRKLFELSPLDPSTASSTQFTSTVPTDSEQQVEITPTTPNAPFHALLRTLARFADAHEGLLPLSGALPDMRTDTASYVRLQELFKDQARAEKEEFAALLREQHPDVASLVSADALDTFVKNAHHVRVLRGRRWGAWEETARGAGLATALQNQPREAATHLVLSAVATLLNDNPDGSTVTLDALKAEVHKLIGENAEVPQELEDAIGEVARAPTADLPNTAAFLGGLIAQEAIKMITKQYVPVNGYCVVDLVDSWTCVIGKDT
ncbi:hypothetical protein WOLCODRAFT_137629 [Wolfiporia cocos MD-104 SS10]|uniref:NEDD8-activating enzyme E1 regulatory subunit n=1 Tax=Wolfiporia cocos (strain MD-104) TaxID=742152 RepID=A0A2H3JSX7_WOLCO|nr:hypothetical protein WOLCODRAFT_137629 [Wolfiporia cocos MD-104 SS10]